MTTSLESLVLPGDDTLPALVLLHGRGSNEHDLFPVGRMLHPTATILSVRAPFDAAPWGYGPGYAWYRFLENTTPEPDSFVAGQLALEGFLASLPARYGVHNGFILGGFSQGGTSSLGYALRHPGSARGVMVFSGFLADHPSVAATPDTVRQTPIFWGHGTADGAIGFEHGEAGWEALRGAGARLTAHAYSRMGHSISAEEIADARAWLAPVVSGGMAGG